MTIAPADFTFVRDLLREHSGFVLEQGKGYLVEARLRGLARQEGFDDIEALLQALRADGVRGPLRTKLMEALLIGETRFFRDDHPFEALRTVILPGLVEEARERRSLRIWCAASATGQEPYSLAMLLADMPALASWDVRIHASDLSRLMLDRVEAGRYSDAEVDRGLPEAMRERWFTRARDGAWQLSPRLRANVHVAQINLLESWAQLPRMDLILIRNVLIYFADETKQDILRRAHEQLRPGGVLLLGTSESLPPGQTRFTQMRAGRTIYYERR